MRSPYSLSSLSKCKPLNYLFALQQPKPPGLRQIQGPFLYGLLVKRLELQAAMFTPSRLLLRMGYDMKSKDLLLNISLSSKFLWVIFSLLAIQIIAVTKYTINYLKLPLKDQRVTNVINEKMCP